ncbi:hypothetical protein EVAR_30477_1 [Eumeta japonica]|uniref:Uncharacterized protein n=1 Tax=Eumeta variegata TaxID=151549 RepID=A0A4C1VY33_EUMVA|nr:hypothetical protein EVAR_30477_1 [Eumeta japonica]
MKDSLESPSRAEPPAEASDTPPPRLKYDKTKLYHENQCLGIHKRRLREMMDDVGEARGVAKGRTNRSPIPEGPVPLHHRITLHQSTLHQYPIPTQEAGNALEIRLEWLVSMNSNDYLLSGGSQVCLSFVSPLMCKEAFRKNSKKLQASYYK